MRWVLTANADRSLDGFLARSIELIDPLATGALVEVTTRDDECLFGLTELDLHAIGLADADVRWTFLLKDEINVERAVANLRYNLSDVQWELLALILDVGRKARGYAVNIIFVERSMYLIIRKDFDLGYLFASTDALTEVFCLILYYLLKKMS